MKERNFDSYKPMEVKMVSVFRENKTVNTYRLKFTDKEDEKKFRFHPGQFAMFAVNGIGECPLSMASSPYEKSFFEISVRNVGNVTNEMSKMKKGDTLGVRGPFGYGYPLENMKGKDIVIVVGGIGFPPLGSAIEYILKNRKDYGKVFVIYGEKDLDDIIFKNRIKKWTKEKGFTVLVTIETPCKKWSGCVGLVTDLFSKIKVDGKKTAGLTCGPPMMVKFVIEGFKKLGICEGNMYVSLERMMQCGIGKCGHCNIGDKYVCRDGPVFSYCDIKDNVERIW